MTTSIIIIIICLGEKIQEEFYKLMCAVKSSSIGMTRENPCVMKPNDLDGCKIQKNRCCQI